MALPYTYSQWVKMGQYVSLKGGKVFFVHKGKGFPLLLLHHHGASSWWFSPVLDKFAEQFSTYVWDMPGCGQSNTPSRTYGPPELSDALEEFMDKLGAKKAHVVGGHATGFVAVHFATTRPTRVARLVLDGISPWDVEEGKTMWETMRTEWLDEKGVPRPVEQWGTQRGGVFPRMDEADRKIALQQRNEDYANHGPWWVATMRQAFQYDVYSRLPLITQPTLLANGEFEWGRIAEQRFLKGIKGARLTIIPGAGTTPSFEAAEAFSKAVIEFLRQPG